MFRHILLAFDGSPLGRQAAAVCGDLASHYAATVTVLTASGRLGRSQPEDADLSPEELGRQVAAEGQRLVEAYGVAVQIVVRPGDPAGQILLAAGDLHVELIVLGHRGLAELGLVGVMGSTATKVVAHAPCDVLVVH